MHYKAVIFDLDGTLLDTLQDLADAGNQTLEQLGFTGHPVDAYRYFVGSGMHTLVERILPEEKTGCSDPAAGDRDFSRKIQAKLVRSIRTVYRHT